MKQSCGLLSNVLGIGGFMIRRIIVCFLLVLLFASCDKQTGRRLTFEMIDKGSALGALGECREKGRYLVFMNRDEMDAMGSLLPLGIDQKLILAVDFTQFFVISAMAGMKGTSGYSVRIEEIIFRESENEVEVKTIIQQPRPGEAVWDAKTFPYHIVQIRKEQLLSKTNLIFIFLDKEGRELARVSKEVP